MFTPRTLRGLALHSCECTSAMLARVLHSYATLSQHELEARFWREQSFFKEGELNLQKKVLRLFLLYRHMFNRRQMSFIVNFLHVRDEDTKRLIKAARENKRKAQQCDDDDSPYKWRAVDDGFDAQGLFSIDLNHTHRHEIPIIEQIMAPILSSVPPTKRGMVEKLVLNISSLCITTEPQATRLALANIILEFVSVTDVVSSLLESIDFEYLSQLFARASKYLRDPDGFEAHGIDLNDHMSEQMFSGLFRILSTAYAFIFDPSYGSKPFMSTEWQRALYTTYRNTNSIPELIEFFFYFLRSSIEFVQVHVLGVEPDYEKSLDHLDMTYKSWADELFLLEEIYMDKEKGVTRQPETRRRILAHYKVGQRISEVIEKAKLITRGSYQHFMMLLSKSSKMAEMARSCGQADRFRVPPYMIQVQGPSGIGKSTCLERLGILLNKCESVPVEEGNIIHTRNQASPYWEGYANQLITCYDDLFQIKEMTKRAEIADELIRVCNSIPMTLNMANVESKGNVIFTSKYVIATTNVFEERSVGLAHPDALWRRFNSRWEFNVPEKYRGDRGPNWTLMAQDHPDIPHEELLYRMMGCTLVKKDGKKVKMTFKEFSDYIISDSARHYRQGYIALEANRRIIDSPMEAQGKVQLDDSTYPSSVTVRDQQTGVSCKILVRYNPSNKEPDALEAQGDSDSNKPEWYIRVSDIWKQFPGAWSSDTINNIVIEEIEYTPSWSETFLEGFASLLPTPTYSELVSTRLYQAIRAIRSVPDYSNKLSQGLRVHMASRLRDRESIVSTLKSVFSGIQIALCFYSGVKITQYVSAWWMAPTYESQSQEWKDKKFTRSKRNITPKKNKPTFTVGSGAKNSFDAHGSSWSSDYLKKIRMNLARVELCLDFGDEILRDRQNVIFITGSVALCTAHFVHSILDCNTENSYLTLSTSTLCKKIPISKIKWLVPGDDSGLDVALIDFCDTSIQRGSIIERFLTKEDLENARIASSTFMQYVPNDNQRGSYIERAIDNATVQDQSPVYVRNENSYQIAHHVRYNLQTAHGDCGSAVLHNDFSKQAAILGIHVAGRGNKADGFAQVVTRDLLCNMLNALGIDTERIRFPDVSPLPEASAERFAAYGNIDTFGQVSPDMAVVMPTKTKIKESLVHGMFQEPTHAPAMLKKVGDISPTYVALAKANIDDGHYYPEFLHECEQHMVHVRNNLPTFGYAKTLSNYETANGFKGTNHLKPINIHTSPGYPYVKNRKFPGKLDWFGQSEDGTVLLTKEFLSEIEADEQLLRDGKIPFYPFTSCLKDEKRPKEKVAAGKTRLFSSGNQKHLFLCRKYYGGYNAFLTANKDDLSSKVGLAANGPEFHEFHKYMVRGRTLKEAKKNFNDGDFSAFDDSIMGSLIVSYFTCAMQWYEFHASKEPDFERNQLIRKNLIPTFLGPPHILGKVFYSLTKANSSGNFATVHINGHVNELIHRYAFIKLGEDHGADNKLFDKEVNLATYGDDSIMCISDDVVNWYNGLTLGPIFKKDFGMTYTPANKSSEFFPVRDIDQVDFCKRSFHYSEDIRRVVGIMPIEGILETTNWIKESVDDEDSTIANIESAHRELFLHGKTVYDEYTDIFTKGCATAGIRYIPKSFRALKKDFYRGLF